MLNERTSEIYYLFLKRRKSCGVYNKRVTWIKITTKITVRYAYELMSSRTRRKYVEESRLWDEITICHRSIRPRPAVNVTR